MANKTRTIMLIGCVADKPYFEPYGLNDEEYCAIKVADNSSRREVEVPESPIDAIIDSAPLNYHITSIHGSPIDAINSLASLGYRVISTTYLNNSEEFAWTLEKKL